MRTLITWFLGLAFQLAQVWPVVAVTPPAAAAVKSCECCAGSKSCCCAESQQPDPKPTPQPLTSGGLLKAMAMKTAETRVSAVPRHDDGLAATLAVAQAAAPPVGYAGVRLAVAFCSLVI
ncbi:MAG: hypothetical protein NTW21_16970 [Verrucomicrobia bacterium]|nr:hypothetical protein [Verrucomicrobiota bacterium]